MIPVRVLLVGTALVPPALPRPELLVAVLTPANAPAAREGIRVGGRPPTPLGVRAAIQARCLAAAVAVA